MPRPYTRGSVGVAPRNPRPRVQTTSGREARGRTERWHDANTVVQVRVCRSDYERRETRHDPPPIESAAPWRRGRSVLGRTTASLRACSGRVGRVGRAHPGTQARSSARTHRRRRRHGAHSVHAASQYANTRSASTRSAAGPSYLNTAQGRPPSRPPALVLFPRSRRANWLSENSPGLFLRDHAGDLSNPRIKAGCAGYVCTGRPTAL